MQTKNLLAILAVVVVVIAGGAYAVTRNGSTPTPATPSTGTPAATPPAETPTTAVAPTPTPTAAAAYKDGTYSASGEYKEPAGTASVTVSLTLKDGIVTDSTVTGTADNPDSRRYQKIFIGSYKTYVTGKKIDEVNISNMSGSSLTPAGFNEAVAAIKTQAKA